MRQVYQYSELGERRLIRDALKGIESINAHIHTAKLSSRTFIPDLKEVFGNFKTVKAEKGRNHECLAYITIKGQKNSKLYYRPMKGGTFQYIEIYGETLLHETIFDLYRKLPELNISQLEYTIDLFCSNHIAVAHVFYLLLRNLHFPYCKKVTTAGGRYSGLDLIRSTNAVFIDQRQLFFPCNDN